MSAPRGFLASSRVQGRFEPPRSKSLAQRLQVLAALCEGEFVVPGADQEGRDATLARELGPRLRGLLRGTLHPESDGSLHVGESGTLARLTTAVVALCAPLGSAIRVDADGTLLQRRSPGLFASLRQLGAGFVHRGLEDGWPVTIEPARSVAPLELVQPGSSQEVSGLLLALAAGREGGELRVKGEIPSRPYLEMTVRLLERFGVGVERPAPNTFRVRGPVRAPGAQVEVEPDASSAAVALAAAALSGGELLVPGLGPDSLQGDVRIVEHLAALGCAASAGREGLRGRGRPRRGAQLDLGHEPDLAPVLAIVAAGAALDAGATSTLTGLETLPGKESDRLRVLGEALRRTGFRVHYDARELRIARGERPPEGSLELDPEGDHRMAFALALLGWVVPGVLVRDPDCVSKSWPSFWEDLQSLGAEPAP